MPLPLLRPSLANVRPPDKGRYLISASPPAESDCKARSLSDLGLIYCARGRAAHSSPIFRYIAPLCASKSENSALALPPCSLRSPKSDRLLASRGLSSVRQTVAYDDFPCAGGVDSTARSNTVTCGGQVDHAAHIAVVEPPHVGRSLSWTSPHPLNRVRLRIATP
jgi:hypothetical protein